MKRKVEKNNLLFTMVLICSIILLNILPLQAQKLLELHDGKESYQLNGKYLGYIEDKSKKLTIEEIISSDSEYKFRKIIQDTPNFGYTRSAYWFRFKIRNVSSASTEWILNVRYALLDTVTLFSPVEDGSYKKRAEGLNIPFSNRKMKYRNFVFEVPLQPEQTQTFYLRVEAENSFTVPLRLVSRQGFHEVSNTEQIVIGLLYGFIIIMILYNAFIFFSHRNTSYIYLVVYILAFILYIISENGTAYQYLWPDSPWWAKHAVPFFVAMVVISSSFFVREFLQTAKNASGLDKVIFGFMIGGVLGTVLSLTVSYFISIIYVVVLIVLYSPIIIFAGFFCWKQGYRPAKYFLAAWSALSVGALLYGFKAFGLFPVTSLTEHGVLIGAVMQVVLLSIGLADLINLMSEELKGLKEESDKRSELLVDIMERAEKMSEELIAISDEQTGFSSIFTKLAQDQTELSTEMAASFEELSSEADSIENSMNEQVREGGKSLEMVKILSSVQNEVMSAHESVVSNIVIINDSTQQASDALMAMLEMMGVIKEGGESIQNISIIINDIADKVNLLSLNAAIEAARAGEHGRGFAVVADEIGKLAFATTDNAKEISVRIENISQDIERSITDVLTTSESIESVSRIASSIQSQIELVASSMKRQETAVGEVSRQSAIITELAMQISQSTRDQRSAMESNASAIQQLPEMAMDMLSKNKKLSEMTSKIRNKADGLKNIIMGTGKGSKES